MSDRKRVVLVLLAIAATLALLLWAAAPWLDEPTHEAWRRLPWPDAGP